MIAMRWDNLFADFEAQLASAGQLEHETHVAELVRAEAGGVALADRLRGHGAAPVDLLLRCGVRLTGRVRHLSDAWLVLESPPRTALVPFAAVVTAGGLGRAARQEESTVRRRLSMASALRAIARDRAVVTCFVDGGGNEPLAVVGTLDTVGTDYAEISPVRGGGGTAGAGVRAVPFAALIAVRSGG